MAQNKIIRMEDAKNLAHKINDEQKAKAEERKSMAIAAENEMKARVQEMRAEVIRAEAEVPKALAKALSMGKISVNDYYEMQNIKADTAMRKAFDDEEGEDENDGGLLFPFHPWS